MLTTYKAILRGNHLEWETGPPPEAENATPIPVEVTVRPTEHKASGAELAKILQRLADMNAFADIDDPVEWQREIRKDRPLPGREDNDS